jgi:hypothetical protein
MLPLLGRSSQRIAFSHGREISGFCPAASSLPVNPTG